MINFIFFTITLPIYILWLCACAVLSLIGMILPIKIQSIDLTVVKSRETVCKVLNDKGLLTNEEYSFETNEVASLYDDMTFKGYLLILAPIIFLLKNSKVMDGLLVNLVHKWMHVHRYKINTEEQKPLLIYLWLTPTCISIARALGKTLHFLKI